MSVRSSFRERSREESSMSSLALEAQRMVRDAAQPISPGETVKSQRRRAARALGYRDGDWRIRTAWYGEAGSWSAAAFEQLRRKYDAWRQRQSKSAETELANLGRIYAALASRLEATDGEFHRADIDRLIEMARRFGRENDGAVK